MGQEPTRPVDDGLVMIYIIIGSATGLLIGMVGVGGILLAPLLVYVAGIDLHLAMATSSWSFLFTGISGTIAYARRGTISWQMVGWLCVGIVPATILGAKVNVMLQAGILTIILAVLVVSSGLSALLRKPTAEQVKPRASRLVLVLVGLATGFGSALTGTGGPVLLLPISVLLGIPTLVAIGASQAIQLPIAVFASVGFFLYGKTDFRLGALLGIVQAIAVVVGAQIAHKVSAGRLRRIVAMALVAAGLFMIVRTVV
jgi:uncharacterized membrane protein YfcA